MTQWGIRVPGGRMPEPSLTPPDYFDTTCTCPECGGDKVVPKKDEDGEEYQDKCDFCEGEGWIFDE